MAADPKSVSQEELERTAGAAADAAAAAVAHSAADDADDADDIDTARSEFWIEKYEELHNDYSRSSNRVP